MNMIFRMDRITFYNPLILSKQHRDQPKNYNPVKPSFFGNKILLDISLEEIREYIDWGPFFSLWQLRGKYPNKGYPKIFNDPNVGEEAKKIFKEANDFIDIIIKERKIKANAIFGFYKANSVDDFYTS